jgi:hypothetical protein
MLASPQVAEIRRRARGISSRLNTRNQSLVTDFSACWIMESRALGFYRDQDRFWLPFLLFAETTFVDIEQKLGCTQQ